MSFARAHFLRVSAELAANTDQPGYDPQCTAYELMLAKLNQDRLRLKQIQSRNSKIAVKRELLPEYVPWVDGALKGNGVQDEVLMTVMVWRIDAGDWHGALDIAQYAIRFNLSLPSQFERNVPCLIAEELADQALDGKDVPYDILLDAEGLLANLDMPDEVRAKLCKAIACNRRDAALDAKADEAAGMKRSALMWFENARKLDSASGVKKDIERLQRDLKNLASAADKPATES